MAQATIPRKASKKSAKAQPGAQGAALAMVFLQRFEQRADEALKEQLSMKDALRELHDAGMDHDSHIEYRKALEAKRDSITAEGKKGGLTITAYRAADARADSIYVSISLWLKMSRAVELGWNPDYDKAWSEISASATAKLDAQAASEAQAKRATELASYAKERDEAATPEAKSVAEAKITLLNAAQVANPESGSPTARTSAIGRKRAGRPVATTKSLFDQMLPIIKDHPLQDVERLHVQLGEYIKARTTREGAPVNAGLTIGEAVKAQAKVGIGTEIRREPIAAKANAKVKDKPSRK